MCKLTWEHVLFRSALVEIQENGGLGTAYTHHLGSVLLVVSRYDDDLIEVKEFLEFFTKHLGPNWVTAKTAITPENLATGFAYLK
jgi:hypothetical protein